MRTVIVLMSNVIYACILLYLNSYSTLIFNVINVNKINHIYKILGRYIFKTWKYLKTKWFPRTTRMVARNLSRIFLNLTSFALSSVLSVKNHMNQRTHPQGWRKNLGCINFIPFFFTNSLDGETYCWPTVIYSLCKLRLKTYHIMYLFYILLFALFKWYFAVCIYNSLAEKRFIGTLAFSINDVTAGRHWKQDRILRWNPIVGGALAL